MTNRVGVIGLGAMGVGMVKNLLKAGFTTRVFDIRDEPVRQLEALGAEPAGSPKEIAHSSDVVVVMVFSGAQVEQVILGENGVLEGMKKNGIIVVTSTVAPSLVRTIAEKAKGYGVGVVDAGVSGIPEVAEAGNLTIMAGGSRANFERCRPMLEAVGRDIFHLGEVGAGLLCKLVNNTIVSASMAAVTEALAVGVKSGIPLVKLLEVLQLSTGNSWTVSHWEAVMAMKKASQQGGGPLAIIDKDVGLFLDLARELALPVPCCAVLPEIDVCRQP